MFEKILERKKTYKDPSLRIGLTNAEISWHKGITYFMNFVDLKQQSLS